MKNGKAFTVSPATPILETMRVIDREKTQIALVADEAGRLLGTVTDGDIRRGILRGLPLDAPVSQVMNAKPVLAKHTSDPQQILDIMRKLKIHQVPVVDEAGIVLGLETQDDLLRPERRENWVVLMAGGEGTRLLPLTEDCPKPLLRVGDRPILETILMGFVEQGFHQFFISIKYKGEMIEEHFGDGKKWGVEIRYLREDSPLGTAGALGLLPARPELPLIVMNGDVLTQVKFSRILDFHLQRGAEATMGVRDFTFRIPFGVVNTENEAIVGLEEKPLKQYFVNAGIYVVSPAALAELKPGERLDMPSLFQRVNDRRGLTVAYPIQEYWMDIGRLGDFDRANHEFGSVFK
jgi:dTDP-glucose pyrophosphorylase